MAKHLKFVPQLDSLRFFAVLLVMIAHWIPNNPVNRIPNGYLGVTFFFVLSGYLISSNLFYLKISIDQQELQLPSAFKIFYTRRTLRIFPLYFLVIFLTFLIIPKIFMGNFIWYVTYLPNCAFLVFGGRRAILPVMAITDFYNKVAMA
jgi:peptidoglycan/LPS O-acetylase OafA/YrhL